MTRDEYGDAYQGGFIRTIRFLVKQGVPKDMAPEVAQSAWATGWEEVGQLSCDAMVLVWVNSIAINAYRQTLRRAPMLENLLDLPGPDQSLAWIDVVQLLRLCHRGERILLEKQMRGETTREIASSYGVTQTAIRLRLLRARLRIRSQLGMRQDSLKQRAIPELERQPWEPIPWISTSPLTASRLITTSSAGFNKNSCCALWKQLSPPGAPRPPDAGKHQLQRG